MNQKAKIKELQKQINTLTDKWKRALADYANLEKRVSQEQQEFVKFFNTELLQKLLTVLDHLEKAEAHLKDQGLTLAVNEFKRVLKEQGVEEIKMDQKQFDPLTMECVDTALGSKDEISEVCQKGYLLNNKLLRPTKVKVGSHLKS